MERFFILDDFNTWADWDLLVMSKSITPPNVKTNYINIDGMSGTIDGTEALTGEPPYDDRTISATFWTDKGTYKERISLLDKIIAALHGRKVRIIEPDDSEHYFVGRISIKSLNNNLAYLEFTIEAICEPWRYALEPIERLVTVNGNSITVIFENNGVKTLSPELTVTGSIDITHNDETVSVTDGVYKISDLKLKYGVNAVTVSGNGSVIFRYTEATL